MHSRARVLSKALTVLLIGLVIFTGCIGTTLALEQPIRVLPTSAKVVALTFDGTFDPGSINEIMRTLNEENVTATFFLSGIFIDNFPDDALRIRDNCFAIGNHSDTHPHMTQLTDAEIIAEATVARQKMIDVLGVDTRPFFRLPYGEYNNRVLAALERAGYYRTIQWDIDTIDWRADTTEQDIFNRVRRGIVSGYPNGTFQPLAPVERQHIAKLTVLAEGYTIDTSGTPFVDVPPSLWSFPYIMTAKNTGIMVGYSDGTFKPSQPSSRAEAATVVWRITR